MDRVTEEHGRYKAALEKLSYFSLEFYEVREIAKEALRVPSDPAEPKSDGGSEFPKNPFESGGRNALNLQMLEQVRDTLKLMHKASLEKGNTAKSAEICNRSYAAFRDALELVNNSLQSAQAASDGKEQGTPRQPTKQSGPPPCAMCSRPPHPDYYGHSYRPESASSSSATVRGPMEELVSRIQNYLGNGGLFNPECMEHEKVRDLLIDVRDFLSASPPLPDNGEAVQTKDLGE